MYTYNHYPNYWNTKLYKLNRNLAYRERRRISNWNFCVCTNTIEDTDRFGPVDMRRVEKKNAREKYARLVFQRIENKLAKIFTRIPNDNCLTSEAVKRIDCGFLMLFPLWFAMRGDD